MSEINVPSTTPTERRLRLAALLILLGLAVEAVTLAFVHPLAFLAFVWVGGGLLALGIVLYLLALVNPRS